ncbi:MAG: hypothetical protein QOG49_890, partial [Frankiaceae bacterium]|nr:hypothetical protein [Frankiaceae bacterium]
DRVLSSHCGRPLGSCCPQPAGCGRSCRNEPVTCGFSRLPRSRPHRHPHPVHARRRLVANDRCAAGHGTTSPAAQRRRSRDAGGGPPGNADTSLARAAGGPAGEVTAPGDDNACREAQSSSCPQPPQYDTMSVDPRCLTGLRRLRIVVRSCAGTPVRCPRGRLSRPAPDVIPSGAFREQAYVPAEQPPSCQDARLPAAHAHPRRPRHSCCPARQGPPGAGGLTCSPPPRGCAEARTTAP